MSRLCAARGLSWAQPSCGVKHETRAATEDSGGVKLGVATAEGLRVPGAQECHTPGDERELRLNSCRLAGGQFTSLDLGLTISYFIGSCGILSYV